MGSAIGNGDSNSGGDGGTISITGGDVTATATGSWGAGIGGLCKSITIGGNAVVHATGGNWGAGIGGYYQKAVGNITIEGNANVTATGGVSGAGIGTGSEAEGEAVITITGGTVNASMSASNGAAAIGSGYKSKGKTTVSISGGQVTASGSSIYGVGIGGGNTGAAGEEVVVNITGGVVDASGRAGIGTANASNAKLTINISGGKVTARGAIDGSNKCAAIGQGNNSNSVTEINITGGIVRALGTGTGIGSGANSKQTPTIKLDYTDEMKNGMEITAIDYNGTVTLNKSFKYQDGTGAVSTPITANKTIVPSDSTAHTHGFTYTVDGKTITATCTNSDNQCNLTEHKATLTIGEPDGKTSMVYDGTAKAAVLTGDTDVLTADVVYKKGNTVLPSAPSDAGNYTASITLGEATATVSYEITKKSVTFASITAKDKVYDGTTKASCSIGTGVNGAVSGDSVSANVSSGVANFDTPDVGVNKAVTFTNWTLQGSSKDNYEMVQPEPQYRTITPRVITITAKAQTVQQGGIVTSSPEQVEVTSGTLAEGQQISEITLTGDTSAITTNGSITPSEVKILDASNNDVTANYVVNYSTGTLTVKEALPHTHEFTYSATGNNITATCANSESNCLLPDQKAVLTINAPTELTYDGTAKEANVSGSIPGITIPGIVYTKDDAVFAGIPTEAGTYTASITVEGVTASVSYTITLNPIKIVPTLTVSDYTKTYDGNSVTISDLTKSAKDGSSDIEGTWDFEGTPGLKDVSDSGTITVRFMPTDTTNYESTTTTFTLTINRKDVTVKADNKSMVVGTTPEPELTATVSGTVGSDTVIYSLDREAGTVVGDYVITPSGDTLQGNYTVSYETGTFTITEDTTAPVVKKAPKAITGLVYNGTAQALVEPGEAENGTMYYAVTTENTAPADNLYTTSNYTATDAGTYYVWYKVVGDENYNDVDAECIEVTIEEKPAKEEPAKEEPSKEEPKPEEPAKEEPKPEEPAKEEPKPEEPAKEEPTTEEPVVLKPEDLDEGELVADNDGLHFYIQDNGDVTCYTANDKEVYRGFACDGTDTYFFQYDGTAMRDRLTYHPDGEHVIYFDENGHEVFNDYAHVKHSIAGEEVDDYCFFDVYGHMYVDVLTWDQTGTKLLYANPYGVLEVGKWFQFSETVVWADGTPVDEGMAGGYGYAMEDATLMRDQYTFDWEGRLCYMQGNGVALY